MIPLLSVDEARRRASEAGIQPEFATLNVMRALLHNPGVAAPLAALLNTLLFRGKLDARTRELVILRTGWRTKSEYEFCQHVALARRIGMKDEDILGVRDPERCGSYSEVDRAVIRMTDELMDSYRIAPATWAVLERNFPPEQLVELLLAAGNWRMFAIFLNGAKVPLDEGVASWPEGKAPA